MVTQKCFQDFWQVNDGDMPPLAHILREKLFTDKWFRIHSLPSSKRYAESDKGICVPKISTQFWA